MVKSLKLVLLVALAIAAMSTAAFADPMIAGGYSIIGNYIPVNGQTGATTTLLAATGLDFTTLFGTTKTPGVAGQFLVTSSNGTFALNGVVGGSGGTIKDFTFTGTGSANYPTTPISSLELVNGFTFDLDSVSVNHHDANTLDLVGVGTFHHVGYADTPGSFVLTANSIAGTFSFSASQGAVPEPASLMLLGSGLMGIGSFARRKLRR